MKNERKKYILILEDDPILVEMFDSLLSASFCDYNIKVISDYDEAITFASGELNNIKACLIDGRVGKKFGWDFVKTIKDKGYNGKTMYIGANDPPIKFYYLFDDFCLKPQSIKELKNRITKLI